MSEYRESEVRQAERRFPVAITRIAFLLLALGAAFSVGNYLGSLHFGDDVTPAVATSTQLARNSSPAFEPKVATGNDRPEMGRGIAGKGQNSVTEPDSAAPANRQSNYGQLNYGQSNYDSANRSDRVIAPPETAGSLKLRLRTTTDLSSASAQPGEVVTFVTEDAIRDASGTLVPAGSLVEGVISQADSSATHGSGRLVFEIRALHVGTRSMSLRALPLATLAVDPHGKTAEDAGAAHYESSDVGRPGRIPSLNELNEIPKWVLDRARSTFKGTRELEQPQQKAANLTQACSSHEVVVPKESILEFELLQAPAVPQPPGMHPRREGIAPGRELSPSPARHPHTSVRTAQG